MFFISVELSEEVFGSLTNLMQSLQIPSGCAYKSSVSSYKMAPWLVDACLSRTLVVEKTN